LFHRKHIYLKILLFLVMVLLFNICSGYRGFEPRSGQTKDYNIDIWCFSAKHATLRRKNKDWSARNPNNVSECSDMPARGLLFQWASANKIQLNVFVYNKADLIIISLKINLFSPWNSWNIAKLALTNNHTLILTNIWTILKYLRLDCYIISIQCKGK
jgi:hypothetical protein